MKHKHSRAVLPTCASWALTAATVVLGFTAPALAHETLKLEAPKQVSKQVRGSYAVTVAPHGVVMVRITPVL